MKKIIVLFVISCLFLTSCSIFTEADEEPLFLEKHNMSVWERTNNSNNGVQKVYMRILNNPKKIAERWSSTGPNDVCYLKIVYGNGFDVSIGSNTEDYFEIEQKTDYDDQDRITFNIINDELIQSGYTSNAHGAYNWSYTWVKSEVNVDDLISCDY